MNKLSQQQIKLDERNHVELPLLEQLKGLGWEVLDLQAQQTPGQTHRSSLTEVLMQPVLRAQLQQIQPWLQDDQPMRWCSSWPPCPAATCCKTTSMCFAC